MTPLLIDDDGGAAAGCLKVINGNGRRGRFWLLCSSFEQSEASEVFDGIRRVVTTPLRLGGKAQVKQL